MWNCARILFLNLILNAYWIIALADSTPNICSTDICSTESEILSKHIYESYSPCTDFRTASCYSSNQHQLTNTVKSIDDELKIYLKNEMKSEYAASKLARTFFKSCMQYETTQGKHIEFK